MILTERSFDDPVIEVMSQSPRLEMLQARLRQAGMRPVAISSVQNHNSIDPLFVDLDVYPNAQIDSPQRLIVTLGAAKPDNVNSIHLSDTNLIQTLPTRLAIRRRERQRQREAALRAETAKQLGQAQNTSNAQIKPRLLWLGQNAPFLNAIKSNLQANGIELVAALSRVTAEDYLAKGGFDALMLYPSNAGDEASQFLKKHLSTDRSDTAKLVLLTTPETAAAIDRKNMDKVDAILDLVNEPDILSRRLLGFCETLSRAEPARHRLATHTTEKMTGLATRAFLEAHLQTQLRDADETGERLCLLALTATDGTALPLIAETIRPLLRETDLAARLDQDHICLTMPATAYRGAVTLARRIEAELTATISWRVIERRRFHTLKTLLGGLTAKPHVSIRRKSA